VADGRSLLLLRDFQVGHDAQPRGHATRAQHTLSAREEILRVLTLMFAAPDEARPAAR